MKPSPRLGRQFFQRYTPAVARGLLGCRLVRAVEGQRLAGIIVETEAYRGGGDPASHAFRGRTPRNEVMFGPAGCAYVYFTMGMHFCLNVTTEGEGMPGAVLLRAVEPVEGIEKMKEKRGVEGVRRLASGPGNLTRALGIDGRLNGEDMVISSRLFLEQGEAAKEIGVSPRVGVSTGRAYMWRFYAKGNPFISRGKPAIATQNP